MSTLAFLWQINVNKSNINISEITFFKNSYAHQINKKIYHVNTIIFFVYANIMMHY